MRKLVILLFAISSLLLSCDDPISIKFKNQVKGANPIELIGEYVMAWEEDSVMKEVIYSFSYLGKRTYLITDQEEDTVFMGRIVRKKGDYYLNSEADEKNYWDITSFRLREDSIYNFWRAFYWGNDEDLMIEGDYFKKYKKVVVEERETYYMNNRQKETLKAFQTINDQAKGIYFKKIEKGAEDGSIVELEAELSEELIGEEVLQLDIYPNPFAERLTLEMNQSMKGKVELFFLSGQLAIATEFEGVNFEWQLPELANGVYILRITDQEGQLIKTEKVIKR